jgi:hypothetical protein
MLIGFRGAPEKVAGRERSLGWISGELLENDGRQLAALLLEFLAEAVAVLNMLHLRSVEVVEKPPGFCGVMAVPGKVCNPLLLLGNMSLALGNMPLGFFQMAKLHRAIHGTA